MEFFRLAAFAVSPSRTAQTPQPIQGGMLAITADLDAAVSDAADRVRVVDWTSVDFMVDEDTRTCEMRELALAFGFGDDMSARDAGQSIGARLANAMDMRSFPFLLLIAAYREEDERKVGLWAFPRDDAFRFRGGDRPIIELLADVFSRTSRLRKGAEFSGANHRASFLSGRVFDLQSGRETTNVANYWMERFLQCTLAVTPVIGTTVLAQALRRLYQETADPTDRSQVHVAAIAVRIAPEQSFSLAEFGDRYLNPELAESLLGASPQPQINNSRFRFSRETFDRLVTTAVYNLDNGVIVSSPLEQIGDAVRITDNQTLTATGRIERERIRGR